LTRTFPERTSTLTLWPSTGGPTLLAAPAGVEPWPGTGAGGWGVGTGGAAVVKGTSAPLAKPWRLKAIRRTW
jgi:hypothetical protein